MFGLSLCAIVITILDLQCRNKMEVDDDMHSPSVFVGFHVDVLINEE